MDVKQLQAAIFELLRARQLKEAEAFLLQKKPLFRGRALGKWHHLYAQIACRVRPEDHDGFFAACTDALRLLQGDQESLCALWITQVSQAIVWRDWHQARVGIRRLRAMVRRHPTDYGIQRLQGMALINEALVERISGNFARAVSLALSGIEALEHYAYPADESIRRPMIAMTYLEAADCYLRLGERAKALEALSKVDPAQVPQRDYPRYCYVQSRYWLALGVVQRAEQWADQIESNLNWEVDWPALLLELKAGIAKARGQLGLAEQLMTEALAHASAAQNQVLSTILRTEITLLKGM